MAPTVYYAPTDEGQDWPVVDITNPAFAVNPTEAELDAMREQFIETARQMEHLPDAVRQAVERSRLGRGLTAASGTFLTGMNTYLLKLGPHGLGADCDPIDRAIAGSFPVFAMRLRLQDASRMVADGLAAGLTARPDRPLRLVNIAGGPAADSWNALMLLRARQPARLTRVSIAIDVLDLDERGPAFGARALAALSVPGGPLEGLAVAFRHTRYDWSLPARLAESLAASGATGWTCVVSSEGGLFEYGDDGTIVGNLACLHEGTAADARVVGSVTRAGAPTRSIGGRVGAAVRPRTLEQFTGLASRAGWVPLEVIERPFSYNLALRKA
jgi:hypothetical protein